MTITTAQGLKVETIEHLGRSTPYRVGEYVVVAVAVNRQPCPPFQVPVPQWQEDLAKFDEDEFWQNVADGALSMRDAEAALR